MKVMTILGTRPEIIRLSIIIKKLDKYADKHILIHTGQNFIPSLSNVMFQELNVRNPDYVLLKQQHSLGDQLSELYKDLALILAKEKPNKLLILGDTNSGLSAILAERMGIDVVHMEAGNRCFDLEVPEEKNRRVIDAISSFNLSYTPQSRENLIKENIPQNRVMVSGNPICEVLAYYKQHIEQSNILTKLTLKKEDYFLLTIHRAENVDHKERFLEIMRGINRVAEVFQKRVICSIHPRTKSCLERHSVGEVHPLVEFHDPFSFFDFVKLEKNSLCVLTDSGTVQEECCLFYVPTVTIRQTTERPETIECGSNMLSGIDAQRIVQCVEVMINQPRNWSYPEGYNDQNVSDKVIKMILGGLNVC